MKKATIILAALLSCALPASAESGVYAGEVIAEREVSVRAPVDGAIESYAVRAGQTVSEGEAIAFYATEKVYAAGDGTVAAVWAEAGEEVNGTLVEVEPIERYTVYCTTDGAYESADAVFVHAGETVSIQCTADGTHRGTGIITSVDGASYMVATTGGNFYAGEAVHLYRDADFTDSQRIGVGTLIYADNALYEADGYVIRLCVKAGDRVERGQLLYETLGCKAAEVTAPVSGIVASVGSEIGSEDVEADSQAGEAQGVAASSQGADGAEASEESSVSERAVSEGDLLAVIVPFDSIMVEITVPEDSLGAISVGRVVEVAFADDPSQTVPGVIVRISCIAEDGAYRAILSVERQNLSIGMSCDVMTN